MATKKTDTAPAADQSAAEPKPESVAAEIGGWFKNISAHAVVILHKLGTFVVEAGQVTHLPFAAEHRDLVQATEAEAKQAADKLAAQAEADAKAAAETAAKDAAPVVAAAVTDTIEKEL